MLPPHTGGELGQRLDGPLQEEEVGLAPPPDPPHRAQDLTAQRRVLGPQHGVLQEHEGRQVLHWSTWEGGARGVKRHRKNDRRSHPEAFYDNFTSNDFTRLHSSRHFSREHYETVSSLPHYNTSVQPNVNTRALRL